MDQKKRILIVDDESQFRETTKKILERRGFRTMLADSGEAALEQLSQDPDVVILDIKMSGMGGIETLEALRKRRPDLPVIMLTGHGGLASAKEALETGAYDYLTKPCDVDLMISRIMDACQYGKAQNNIEERRVEDVMIPIEEYTTVTESSTVRDAVEKLRASFSCQLSSDKIMETGHRSLLVLDNNGEMLGILTIIDLLRALMPTYLTSAKPSTADSIHYSPMFWSGMFTREVLNLADRPIEDIMSPAPLTIDAGANLMEAAELMVMKKKRRLAAKDGGKIVGVVREQDLFFEIDHILR